MKKQSDLKAKKPKARQKEKYEVGMWRKGTKPVVDESKCEQCMVCFAVCPHSAIEKTKEAIKINHDVCTGCMLCLRECPEEALTEERE